MKSSIALFTVFILEFFAPHHLLAQEWTRFRGPNGTGLSDAKTIPTRFSESDFNWKISLQGSGHSSPVGWGDKIFLLSGDEKKGQVFVQCVAAQDGKMLWQRTFPIKVFRH